MILYDGNFHFYTKLQKKAFYQRRCRRKALRRLKCVLGISDVFCGTNKFSPYLVSASPLWFFRLGFGLCVSKLGQFLWLLGLIVPNFRRQEAEKIALCPSSDHFQLNLWPPWLPDYPLRSEGSDFFGQPKIAQDLQLIRTLQIIIINKTRDHFCLNNN